MNNIHPVFDKIKGREYKEKVLNQKAKNFWFVGLSGSGKTTTAVALEKKLMENGFFTQILDGDNIRAGINNNLGFSLEDRYENIRRISEVTKLFLNCGIITLNCFVSPTKDVRVMAKKIIGQDDFFEIYIKAPIQVCEDRDVKGLYKKARNGEIKDFTGINSPFEEPENPFLILETNIMTVEESGEYLYQQILPLITYLS